MNEYIYEIESHEDNESEIFIGWIRNHSQELIRCKDCIHYDQIDSRYGYCDDFEEGKVVNTDGFCAWSERKER